VLPGHKDRSRNLILDAADAAFREKGFAVVSMEEIARRASLTRMTIYNLFGSKEQIALAIIMRAEEQTAPAYAGRMAAGECAVTLLEQAFVESARWCLENPSLAQLALKGSPSGNPMEPPPDRPSFHGLIRDLMILGQNQGTIRRDKAPEILAAVLLGAYAQMMLSALAGGPFQEAWTKNLVRLLIEGFGTRSLTESDASPTRNDAKPQRRKRRSS
jgi:TetR/AcrR family transcriptional regulator of autoinduction and epiphytic fitness